MSGTMQPETRYAKVGDDYIGYQVIGDGPLDLVFIPAWNTNVDIMWEEPSLARFLRRLASFTRLICFDKRGTGISDPVPLAAIPTLEQWLDDVRAVMDTVDSARAAVLGHAEGGGMAMLFAATYPQQTSALVLMDTFARPLRDSDYPCGIPPDRVPTFLQRFEERWGTGANVGQIAPSVAGDARFRQWYARYERLGIGRRAATATYAAMFEADLRHVLPAVRVPVLILHHRGNRYIQVGHGHYLAAHLPGAKYVELSGDDHLFYVGDIDRPLDEIQEFLTGMRPAPELDRVLATVLFTDVVGSTEHAARLGDRAWRALLETYYGLARHELERYRGKEIETAGDGLLATFDGPARAIRCACAITQAVHGLGLELRAGLHTGEIELADDRIRGIAVHIAARVAAEAGAGEVLVSSTVKDLVAGSGIRFTDRQLRVLKGVPGEWHLFAAS